ncbi:MAG: hypothetical protein ABSA51_07495 [Anaerolineaceae bacterium]|jgi:hypothetical protein
MAAYVSVTNPATGQTIQILNDPAIIANHIKLGWKFPSPAFILNSLTNISIAVSTKSGNVINVAVQLRDANQNALANAIVLEAYLSDVATGKTVTATAPDGGVAIGSNGGCIPLIANKCFLLNFETTGLLDLNITNSTSVTWYLVIIFPTSGFIVSAPIAF